MKRFFDRVKKVESGCHEWTGYRTSKGYGQLSFDGKIARAHRVAWILVKGEIPEGQSVLHRCDNPACVNVEHLFLGTQEENIADMVAKGRQQRGIRSASAKIGDDDVRKIRSDTRPLSALAKQYGLSIGTLSFIRNRKTWRHVV